MGTKRKLFIESLMVLTIVILSFLLINKGLTVLSIAGVVHTTFQSKINTLNNTPHTLSNLVSTYSSSDPSSPIPENEYVYTSSVYSNNNLFFNENFYPGNVNFSSNGYYCNAVTKITAPHLCFSLFSLFSCGGGPVKGNFTNLVGYLGFPEQDNNFPNNKGVNYANLYSKANILTPVGNLQIPIYLSFYQLPSAQYPYQNFINWSNSTLHLYSGLSNKNNNYLYAVNNSFTGYTTFSGSIPKSTLIIPAVSCGSTFIHDYIDYPGAVGTLHNIITLSGFTPSVFLASSNQNGYGPDYLYGKILTLGNIWTSFYNSLLSYQIQSINPPFAYTMPSLNYAKFPKGNKGDIQYLNVSSQFSTPVPISYYGSNGGINRNISIYTSNTSISSIVCTKGGSFPNCNGNSEFLNSVTESADTFTSPDLEATYYPNYGNAMYLMFRTDGIFPICAWNSSINNTLSSCTFENPKTMNNISYQRLWLSNNIQNNQLYNDAFSPGYSSTNFQNNFTLAALDSFCFYGEDFNSSNGLYTSPSYTRIIPPTSLENYTHAIGKCNAFFNNTNCFSNGASNYLNFKDGIFATNIACTSTGIKAENITDAWINSIYVANNAGDYCGLFRGQKNPSDPTANSTLFLQNISTNCPEFNANSSSVNLVITVRNVGNTNITNPYLVALYGNNNLSTIFYNSENLQSATYNLYKDFIGAMKATTGIIQVDYNNNFNTDMYVFDPGHPLNPIAIQSLFNAGQGYENGPFNNSLLGMWIYDAGAGLPNNLIRTANTLFVHSNSGNSNVPVIEPNGTATFTLEVPIPLFDALLSGKYNLSVFFGNTFNVSWNTPNGNSPSPTLLNPGALTVNPLVPSSTENASQIHNNEIITPGSGSVSPIWQYISSYTFNLSNSPMRGVDISRDNLFINVTAVNSTSDALNITANPSVSILNGSGSYLLVSSQLKGSSISCFASPDNLQDFGVFWNKQIISPSNLNYALSDSLYSGNTKQASEVLITSWTGILFMPYSDQVALNYNNLPQYSLSTSSFQIEKPTLNITSGNFNYETFTYFGNGNEGNLFNNLSSLYNSLNSTVSSFPVSLPNSSLNFNIFSNSIVSDPSILRIGGTDTLVNYSTFSNNSFTFSLTSKGSLLCSHSENTSANATFESGSSSLVSSCLSKAVVNDSYINISSKYGPFFVDMYNNSNLNLSNESSGGTVLMAGNETLSASSKHGLFMVTLPINTTINNGITLIFSVVPLTRQLYNSTLYLYNINGTPFNCNIVNNYNNTGNLEATAIHSGEYFLPNGTIMCNLTSDFTYLRAVFINKSNNAYLGSGDIQSGLSIQTINSTAFNISLNGVPLNTQDLSIKPNSNTCTSVNDVVVYNGIVQYNSGCNLSEALITFNYNNNGSLLPEAAFISPANYNKNYKNLLFMNPSAISDAPKFEYNLTLPSEGVMGEPIQFSLPNTFGGCNNIRLVTQFPYPYAQVPYQVLSSGSQSCNYVFVGNVGNIFKYSVFESNSPSIPYDYNWIRYNSTQYNVQISTNSFNTDLISSCHSGFGPCLYSFTAGQKLGNLLFNNVSTSSATISQTAEGPVEDCFTVSYSSSQTVEFPETGFGDINYKNNKIYQTAAPSQLISSVYCFYVNSPIITDSIFASGSPINFKVQNQLISNFSYLQDSRLNGFYVPPAINVGYNSYDNVSLGVLNQTYTNVNNSINVLNKCANYTYSSSNITGIVGNYVPAVNISANNILNPEKLYCIYGGTPSYTTQASLASPLNMNSTSSLGFAYQPGNYTNGEGTLYNSCRAPQNLTISGSPNFYVNGVETAYDLSSSKENYTMNNSATQLGIEMLYSPSGKVYIGSCSPNETILSYSACTKPVNVIPSNGSYDNIEAIPNGIDGNFSFGGGCYIGTLNGNTYGCAPTDGAINYSYASKSASSLTVSVSKIIINSTAAPTSTFSLSFDCSIDATNSSSNSELSSCSYPNSISSGVCSTSVSYAKINSTAYNITAECSAVSTKSFKIVSATSKITNLNIIGSQSEKTGLISNYVCGNETSIINNNVLNGWRWNPYSTAGSINPVGTTNPAGIAEVGGCEAGRDSFITTNPNITITKNATTIQYFYSCQTGYTGTITACSSPASLASYNRSISNKLSCYTTNNTRIGTSIKTINVNGNGTGGQAKSCNLFNKAGYLQPTVQDNCIAYHNPVINSTTSAYALQYLNSSNIGVGIGVIGKVYPLNISIPNSKQQNSVKDAYFTGLSESQIEGPHNIFTSILPASLLESNLPGKALSISAIYSYDLLNILMLQNPFFGVSGIPGFTNGSILDYASSIFTGGTSGNCAPPYDVNGDGIFSLGEGELCSGKTLPSSYKEGMFLSLGTLNEGLHSLQFYSIGNSTNEAQPSVSVFDSVGNAVNLNSACSNGNSRVFTSTYTGGKWSINITSDQQCDPINNQLYGYIVNCLYQTPGNETYTISSKYYLAYNLPTIWNISYSLLVSAKSYQVVPTPVYQIDYLNGSILSLQQPNETTFIEKGLPAGYKWYLRYGDLNRSSSSDSIYFYLNGQHTFKVYTLSNISANYDCYTTYTPTPPSGNVISGTTTYIQFTGVTTCYSYFNQKGLPSGLNWNVTYDNIIGSTSMKKPLTARSGGAANSKSNLAIEFITNSSGGTIGNFSFYVSDVTSTSNACTDVYKPSPSSGYLKAGTNQSITFSIESDTCVTTFDESKLPSGYTWNVTYDGIKSTSHTPTIAFITKPGSMPYSVPSLSNSTSVCTTTYIPSPSSSSALLAGSTVQISFSGSTKCITTTFYETGLPSGTWSVSYAGQSNSAPTGSPINITSSNNFLQPSYTATASIHGLACTSSASVIQGGTYNFSSWNCTTTFNELYLPTNGYNSNGAKAIVPWSVDYAGSTVTSSSSSLTVNLSTLQVSTQSFTTTNSGIYYPYPSVGSVEEGATYNVSFTDTPCNDLSFAVYSGSPLTNYYCVGGSEVNVSAYGDAGTEHFKIVGANGNTYVSNNVSSGSLSYNLYAFPLQAYNVSANSTASSFLGALSESALALRFPIIETQGTGSSSGEATLSIDSKYTNNGYLCGVAGGYSVSSNCTYAVNMTALNTLYSAVGGSGSSFYYINPTANFPSAMLLGFNDNNQPFKLYDNSTNTYSVNTGTYSANVSYPVDFNYSVVLIMIASGNMNQNNTISLPSGSHSSFTVANSPSNGRGSNVTAYVYNAQNAGNYILNVSRNGGGNLISEEVLVFNPIPPPYLHLPSPDLNDVLNESGLPSNILSSDGWSGSLVDKSFKSHSTSVSESSGGSATSLFSVNNVVTGSYCSGGHLVEQGYAPNYKTGTINDGQTITISFSYSSDISTSYPCQ